MSADYRLPVVPHPRYEDGAPMLLGDEVIVLSSRGDDQTESTATITKMRFHPDSIVWIAVQGEGHYSNDVIYDHESDRASYIRRKASA